jgi:hypothetical protein
MAKLAGTDAAQLEGTRGPRLRNPMRPSAFAERGSGETGGSDGRKPVNRSTVSQYRNPADYRRDHDAITRPDRSERETTLTPLAALVIITLVSIGLWWAIWLAVSSLASALME